MQELWIQVSWNKVGEGENEEKTKTCAYYYWIVCATEDDNARRRVKFCVNGPSSRFISVEYQRRVVVYVFFLAFSCVHFLRSFAAATCELFHKQFSLVFVSSPFFFAACDSLAVHAIVFRLNREKIVLHIVQERKQQKAMRGTIGWILFFVSPYYSGLKQTYLRTYINELTKGSFFYLFTLLSPSTRLMASTHTHTLTVIKKEINIRIRIKNYFKSDQRKRGGFLFLQQKNYHLFQFPTRVRACIERVSGCCGFGSGDRSLDIQKKHSFPHPLKITHIHT